jgi:preprotein translocase subunit SecE
MARKKEDERKVEEEEDSDTSEPRGSSASEEPSEEEGALVVRGGESIQASADEEKPAASPDDEAEEGEDEEQAATQLGADRYVLAGFFAAGMLGAYVLGRTLQLLWATASNKDWFSRAVPRLAAVSDEDKGTLSLIVAAVVALIFVVRTYRRADVREWTDEVASELTKVKWPNRKDVTNSTIVVIAASAIATVYLALLDRLWAFVTSLVYDRS